jgi:hypothetical protein
MGKSGLALNIGGNVAIRASTADRAVHARDVAVRGDAAAPLAESYVDSQKIRNGRNLGMEDWQRLSAAA